MVKENSVINRAGLRTIRISEPESQPATRQKHKHNKQRTLYHHLNLSSFGIISLLCLLSIPPMQANPEKGTVRRSDELKRSGKEATYRQHKRIKYMFFINLYFLGASSFSTANRRIDNSTTFLKFFIAFFLASTLSINPPSAQAAEQEHQSDTLFRAGDTTHIVENIPSIKALAWNAAFWASLNTIPDIISYAALQILLHKNRPLHSRLQESSAAQWLVFLANIARHTADAYKLASLGKFAIRKTEPVVNQTYRRNNCLRKTGPIPVYIMDIPLARAFTIELQLNDPDKPYVVFHALNPDIQKTDHKLPIAWQRLFDQLHKLHEPTLYASIQKGGLSTRLCLSTVSGHDCQLYLLVKTPDQYVYSSSWDIEMAGQWCPQTTLEIPEPEQGYSVFSTAVIDAMANALAKPNSTGFLSLLQPGKVLWQGNSAVIEPAMESDYQIGWSGTAINPGSGGFITLASHKAPRLTPENMEHIFSNWQYWMNSYQKQWSATPLYWLTTLVTNQASLALRQHIHSSSMALIHEHSQALRHPPIEITGAEDFDPGLSGHDGYPTDTPDIPLPVVTPAPDQFAITTTTSPSIYQPDYSPWGLNENGQMLVARSIILSLSDIDREKDHYRSQTEIEYLQSEHPSPKPVTLILPGVPIDLHLYNYDLIFLISVPSSRALAPFKGNVDTDAKKDLDSYTSKRHPGMESLAQKLYEMNLRRFPLLKDQSWGHITENGKPTTKISTSALTKYYAPTLRENEVILSHYAKEDIKGILITEDTPLLLQTGEHRDLMTILELKETLEKELQLKPLPIYLYSQKAGRITDIAFFSPGELSTLKENLKILSRLFLIFNTNAPRLPALLGTLSNQDYLNLVIQKANSIGLSVTSQIKSATKPDKALEKVFIEKITQDDRDSDFFLRLAQYPEWLVTPQIIPIKHQNLGGPTFSRAIITPLKVTAYSSSEAQNSADPDQLITTFQDRSRLVDQIIMKAGLTEQSTHRPLTDLDFRLNPYAAINWINKGCSIESSATECLNSAFRVMHLLKPSDDLRGKYFDDVITPLFKNLLTSGKLNRRSLLSLISQTKNTFNENLLNYMMGNIERVSKEHKKDLLQFLLINQKFTRVKSTEHLADKSEKAATKIEKAYNQLVILYYLYITTYGDLEEESILNIMGADLILSMLPPTTEGTRIDEIPSKAFYPIKEDNYPEFTEDQQVLNLAAVMHTMLSFESIVELYRKKTLNSPEPQLAELFSALMSIKMATPQGKKISAMLFLVKKQKEWEEISKSHAQSFEHSSDMKLAMTPPYPLAPLMAETMDVQLQKVIEHYYQNPSPAQINSILDGTTDYDPDTLWRNHHGVDHVARTAIILEASIQFHKEFKQNYAELFRKHRHLDRLLPLAMVYHDVGAEIVEKDLEELLASKILEQDLKGADLRAETIELVASALKNKNVNTMNPVLDGYTPDDMASPDEQLIRRLLRIPDSVDIARVRTVSDEFSFATPSEVPEDPIDENIYSMHWMSLDPDMLSSPELMKDWVALMKTSVFWASLTGASPRYLIHPDPATLMPYTVSPNLVTWTDEISQQRKLVITRAPDSLNYTREILFDIVRMFIAQEAGKTVSNVYQLRQISLPENWSTLDSFLHFTDARKAKLQSVIDLWKDRDFTPHHGTLTGSLLSHQAVIDALPSFLSAEKVKRQRGYEPGTNTPIFEDAWELSLTQPPEYGSP